MELQQSAAAMIKESGGAASALTHRIAKAGCYGKHRNNVSRDIAAALELPLVSPSVYTGHVFPNAQSRSSRSLGSFF